MIGSMLAMFVACRMFLSFFGQDLDSDKGPPPAAQPKHDGASIEPPVPSSPTNLGKTVRSVKPGVLQIGRVLLDAQRRTVSFPATLNLNEGPMEYLLVTDYGAAHESILKTEVQPFHIHTAMLLLGVSAPAPRDGRATLPSRIERSGTKNPEPPPLRSPIKTPSSETLRGERIRIELKWRGRDGKRIHRRAGALVFSELTKTMLSHAQWIYNGSFVADDSRFYAQLHGNVISLITDRFALINNVGPGHENDEIWRPFASNLPPPDTPVTVVLRLDPGVQPRP